MIKLRSIYNEIKLVGKNYVYKINSIKQLNNILENYFPSISSMSEDAARVIFNDYNPNGGIFFIFYKNEPFLTSIKGFDLTNKDNQELKKIDFIKYNEVLKFFLKNK